MTGRAHARARESEKASEVDAGGAPRRATPAPPPPRPPPTCLEEVADAAALAHFLERLAPLLHAAAGQQGDAVAHVAGGGGGVAGRGCLGGGKVQRSVQARRAGHIHAIEGKAALRARPLRAARLAAPCSPPPLTRSP